MERGMTLAEQADVAEKNGDTEKAAELRKRDDRSRRAGRGHERAVNTPPESR